MNYKEYIAQLEELQKGTNRLMYLLFLNIIIGLGKETEFEDLKNELRIIYKEVKATSNPFSFQDGTIVNQQAWKKLNEIIINIIDLLNDKYGNFKTLPKKS